MKFEYIQLAVNLIGPVFIGCGLFYSARQVKLLIKSHAENHDWNRRIETLKAIENRSLVDVGDLNRKLKYSGNNTPIALDMILTVFEEDPKLLLMCNIILNFYERLASGVYSGIYDEKIVKMNRKKAMENDLIRFKNYIEYRRNTNNRNAWVLFERLSNEWRKNEVESLDRSQTGYLN